jgi:predicted signal transduction protein with EAL and GGDEF domain
MGDVPLRVGVMRELESTDLRLGIDDFGSGYTLLSYLKRFPIDYLRIDRLFTVSSRGRGEQSSPDSYHRHRASPGPEGARRRVEGAG